MPTEMHPSPAAADVADEELDRRAQRFETFLTVIATLFAVLFVSLVAVVMGLA